MKITLIRKGLLGYNVNQKCCSIKLQNLSGWNWNVVFERTVKLKTVSLNLHFVFKNNIEIYYKCKYISQYVMGS